MMRHLIVTLSAFFLFGTSAYAETASDMNLRVIAPLSNDIRARTIYLEFKSSPKLTDLVSGMLVAKGYKVTATKSDADVHFLMGGAVQIVSGAREGFSTQLAELAESQVSKEVGGPNYTHQTFHGDTIVARAALLRTVSLTEVGMWLTQKTGIAGRVNELLTGDPRGVCLNNCENWKRLRHIVNIPIASVAIDGKPFVKGAWLLQASTYRDKVEVENVVAEALLAALGPFEQVAKAPLATQQPNEGEANRGPQ